MCGCCSRAATVDFPGEPLGPDGGGQLGSQHLDRDLARVLQVLGEIDRGHAPLAQLPLEAVAVGERGGELGRDAGHGRLQSTGYPAQG